MPDDRTTVTELGTALGTLPFPEPARPLARRPDAARIGQATWDQLDCHRDSPAGSRDELGTAFANGRALLEAADGLRGRTPLTIEWTGGRDHRATRWRRSTCASTTST